MVSGTRTPSKNYLDNHSIRQSLQILKLITIYCLCSTIKCGCRWPVHPCLLCTGRTDPTAPRDLPDMMSTQESVALLDPCYHPILSFPEGSILIIFFNVTNFFTIFFLANRKIFSFKIQIAFLHLKINFFAIFKPFSHHCFRCGTKYLHGGNDAPAGVADKSGTNIDESDHQRCSCSAKSQRTR